MREEWEQCFTAEEQGIEAYLSRHDAHQQQQQAHLGRRKSFSAFQHHRHDPSGEKSTSPHAHMPTDAYCFELLSLVQALSGSAVGCHYLARQSELFYDILTLLHTGSDRVKRQVLSLIRRVIGHIKPTTFTRLFGLAELPKLGDIFARSHKSLSAAAGPGSMQGSFHAQPVECSAECSAVEEEEEDKSSVLYHFGPLDIFLAGVAKSLAVTTKIKGKKEFELG